MINDVCNGCFMKIPVGIAHNVRNASMCVNCPTCGRFLYDDYQPPRQGDDNAHYKGIARFSSIELMLADIKSADHAGAIAEMAKLTSDAGFVEDEKEFLDALLRREAVSSTAVGSGVAFPHARGVHAGGLTLAVGLSKKGVDFGNGERPKALFVSAVPTPASMFYMEMVSKIARYFADTARLDKFLECSSPEEMWKIIVKIGR
jgi:mannitol/fructose-specific phosphotransferase system IIA component (Ntr-type)